MKTAQQFFHQLIMLYRPFENGSNKELKKQGIRDGDLVKIGEYEMEWED